MTINIDPVAKPRQTRKDVWNPSETVLRYRSFADELRLKLPRYKPAEKISLVFHIPMPKSWSGKKKALMNTAPHQQKPDADNLLKAFLDALCADDSYVYDAHVIKLWSHEGAITIL